MKKMFVMLAIISSVIASSSLVGCSTAVSRQFDKPILYPDGTAQWFVEGKDRDIWGHDVSTLVLNEGNWRKVPKTVMKQEKGTLCCKAPPPHPVTEMELQLYNVHPVDFNHVGGQGWASGAFYESVGMIGSGFFMGAGNALNGLLTRPSSIKVSNDANNSNWNSNKATGGQGGAGGAGGKGGQGGQGGQGGRGGVGIGQGGAGGNGGNSNATSGSVATGGNAAGGQGGNSSSISGSNSNATGGNATGGAGGNSSSISGSASDSTSAASSN